VSCGVVQDRERWLALGACKHSEGAATLLGGLAGGEPVKVHVCLPMGSRNLWDSAAGGLRCMWVACAALHPSLVLPLPLRCCSNAPAMPRLPLLRSQTL
jgi:hypothetical protein